MSPMFERAARWWAGVDRRESSGRALFVDSEGRRAAREVCELGDRLRGLALAGLIIPVLTPSELASLRASGRAVLECAPHDGRVVARVRPTDELVAARVPVDLADARWIDVEFCDPDGRTYFYTHQAPFDPLAGEIVAVCKRHLALATGILRIRVVDQDRVVRCDIVLDSVAIG